MVATINIEIEEMPETCLDCPFAKTEYYWGNLSLFERNSRGRHGNPKKLPIKTKK